MSSIAKQPNGRWRARYRDPNGRSRSKTFDRRIDAQRFLDDQSTDTRRGEWIDPRLRRQTIDEWADRWWATTARLAESTRRGYWNNLQGYVLPYFTGCKIVDISYMDVEEFVADLYGRGLAPKTIREILNVLVYVLHCAVKANVLRANPARDHSVPARSKKIGTGDVLDMPQAVRLTEAVNAWFRSAVWIMVLCGLRPSELVGLKIGDVDFVRRTIHVHTALVYVQKYGTTPAGYHEKETKSAAGDREIPIPEWLGNDLAEGIARRREKFGADTVTADAYLVVSSKGNRVAGQYLHASVVKPAFKKAGLPPLKTYSLRHSHASLLIAEGADILAVSQRMGHADPIVTLRNYGHLFPGVQETLTEKLDKLREASAGSPPADGVVKPFSAPPGRSRKTRRGHAGHAKDTKTGSNPVKPGQARTDVSPGQDENHQVTGDGTQGV